ncbi:hypothetical protein EJB05_13250, partial [Eragrostis curvula]
MEFFDRPLRSTTLLDELAVEYPSERCSLSDPLLMVQVTEFACSGFVIGLTRNHVVSDAAGLAQFMQAVGELARGFPAPTVVPVVSTISCTIRACVYDESLPTIPPVGATGRTFTASRDAPDFVFLDVTIPSSLIDHIKAKFSKMYSSCKPCTVFEVVAAVLWRCRTRATMSADDPEATTMLFFTANARKLVGAKHGYYGNCVNDLSVTATSGVVANGELMDIVKMIKQAKEQMVVKLSSEDKDGGGGERPQAGQDKKLRNMYNNLGLSCVRNLGLDEADFGSGKPARVMNRVPRMGLPICAACLPWEGNDGANVFSRCVKEEHAGAFLPELARFTA